MAELKPVNDLTFEEALEEMNTIVEKMRANDLTLEESVAAYARGKELAKRCEKLLNKAQGVIQKLDADGKISPVTEDDLRD